MTNSKNRAELKDELKAKTDKLVSWDKELFVNLSKEEVTAKKQGRPRIFRENNGKLLHQLQDTKEYKYFSDVFKEVKNILGENDAKDLSRMFHSNSGISLNDVIFFLNELKNSSKISFDDAFEKLNESEKRIVAHFKTRLQVPRDCTSKMCFRDSERVIKTCAENGFPNAIESYLYGFHPCYSKSKYYFATPQQWKNIFKVVLEEYYEKGSEDAAATASILSEYAE